MGIASEVNCAQRKKILAGIAITEVGSTTLVKERASEKAPYNQKCCLTHTASKAMVHGRLYRADKSNTAWHKGTDQAAISEGVVADAFHRPYF